MSTTDDWHDLVAAVQRYVGNKYGRGCAEITLRLIDGARVREPVPLAAIRTKPEPALRPPQAWASGSVPKHSQDFRLVYWPGLGEFKFSEKQAAVVELLWDAYFSGDNPDVPQANLLRAADSDSGRILDLFRRNSSWNTLIIPGKISGSFRLAEIENDQDE